MTAVKLPNAEKLRGSVVRVPYILLFTRACLFMLPLTMLTKIPFGRAPILASFGSLQRALPNRHLQNGSLAKRVVFFIEEQEPKKVGGFSWPFLTNTIQIITKLSLEPFFYFYTFPKDALVALKKLLHTRS